MAEILMRQKFFRSGFFADFHHIYFFSLKWVILMMNTIGNVETSSVENASVAAVEKEKDGPRGTGKQRFSG